MDTLEEIRKKFIVDKPKDETKKDNTGNANEVLIELDKLVSFRKGQPFSLYDKNKKEEMLESIKQLGILEPIIVRKIENDKYEILSGHNRVDCAKELGHKLIRSQIVDCDDEKATLIMLESNLINRDKILPVEKGYAYKMKFDTLKKMGKVNSIKEFKDLSQNEIEENHAQIHRYIRLTELSKPLQIKVNEDKIPVNAGVELSYLPKDSQEIVNAVIENEDLKISVPQAQRIKLKKADLDYETILKILKNEKEKKIKFTGKLEKRVFKIYKDKFNSDKEFTDLVIELLDKYFGDSTS